MDAPMSYSCLHHPTTVLQRSFHFISAISCVFIGTLTRWHVHPAQWLHRLPDNMSYEEGALCEPLTVALSGLEASGLRLGEPALVWYVLSSEPDRVLAVSKDIDSGAGPIGLVTLMCARAAGAEPIIITDLFQNRLDIAKSLVPTVRTVLVDQSLSPEVQAEKIKELAGLKVKVALECTGFEQSISTAAHVSHLLYYNTKAL